MEIRELSREITNFFCDLRPYEFDDDYDGNFDWFREDVEHVLKTNKDGTLEILKDLEEAKEDAPAQMQGTAVWLAGQLKDFIKENYND